MPNKKTIVCIVCWTIFKYTDAACTFPSHFQSSTFEDSYKGTLTFTSGNMTGWDVVAYNSPVNNWECFIATSYDSSNGGLLVFKTTDSIFALEKYFYAYLCLNITKITDNSLYYYQLHEKEPNAQNERVLVTSDNTLSTIGTTCNFSNVAFEAEFKVLLKTGMASTASQIVSTELFADFDYTYTDASGTSACSSSSDNWVFCDTRTSMTFNFTTCSQPIAYGSSGIWYHIVTVVKTYKYMVVYNSAASHKFTCFTFTDNTKATFVYDYCRSGQTNSVLPEVDGTTIGAKLTMIAYNFCPITTTTTTTTTTTSSPTTMTLTSTTSTSTIKTTSGSIKTLSADGGVSGINITIIGAVAGSVLFIAILILAIVLVYCIKFRKTGVYPLKKANTIMKVEKKLPESIPERRKNTIAVSSIPTLVTEPSTKRGLTTTPNLELPLKRGLTTILNQEPPPKRGLTTIPNLLYHMPTNDANFVQKPLPAIGRSPR